MGQSFHYYIAIHLCFSNDHNQYLAKGGRLNQMERLIDVLLGRSRSQEIINKYQLNILVYFRLPLNMIPFLFI